MNISSDYGENSPFSVQVALTLESVADFDAEKIEAVLLGHSCHKAAIPKILECLKSGGKYQCWMREAVETEINRAGNLHRAGVNFWRVKKAVPPYGN